MVVLVPSQRIFPFMISKEKQAREIRILEKRIRMEGCTSAEENALHSTKLMPPTPAALQPV